ncbi:MAG: periplasmic copper chaperone [Massilia sp.]
MRYAIHVAIMAFSLQAAAAQAQVSVKDAWVRATVPHQKATGAFMQLQSTTDTRLVEVTSPVTPAVEIHEMAMQGEVMRMRKVEGVALPAGKIVELRPGSYHVMLFDLKRQMEVGETVPLKLVFEGKDGRRESVDTRAVVRPLNAGPRPAGATRSTP